MKILRLIIKNPDNKVIRDVKLSPKGTSVVYGNVNKPENNKETSNSIGKSLFLKFCDYILGANEDNNIVKEKIHGWKLRAKVEFKNESYIVERILGSSNTYVNNNPNPYTIEEYREKFGINRNFYSKQVFIKQKSHIISMRNEPVLNDFYGFFNLLNLEQLPIQTKLFYQVQDELKKLKSLEKQIAGFYTNFKPKEIKERIFLLNQQVKEKEHEIDELNQKISKMDINDERMELIEKHSNKNYLIKAHKKELEKVKLEIKRLDEFLVKSNKVDVSSKQIMKLYERANIEVPEMINKRLKEVEEFHKTVFLERKEIVNEQIESIQQQEQQLENKISLLKSDLNKLSNLISENEAYKEAMKIYESKSTNLQELKYEQGELNKIETTIKDREEKEEDLNEKYNLLKAIFYEKEELIEKYREYIYSLVKYIYVNKVEAYFSIDMRKKHQNYRPFTIELNLSGDAGEGVGEIKKLLVDLLLFKFNEIIDLLIHDSSCYSGGIDNRQIASIIKIADNIAKETNKQFILSINDFQLKKDDSELMSLIDNNTVLELDEDKKLLKIDFT